MNEAMAPKPLSQLTAAQRAALFPIILCEYNPIWPIWYDEEKINLERLAGARRIARISHCGSTAVPGLLAKPTIDILLELHKGTDINQLIAALSCQEYICLHPPDIPSLPPHLTILKGYTPAGFAEKVYHIHVRYPGDPDELYFRDYLIAHPETAAAYAALKRELLARYEYKRDSYTEAKTEFIKAITGIARGTARRFYNIP